MKETNLKLSYKQETDLVDYLMDRMEQLKTDNKDRIDADKLSGARDLNDRSDRFEHDTVWANSNVPVPMTSLIVDHFLARAADEITGSRPDF